MGERMTPADVAFLLRETRTSPQHVGQLAVFRTPAGGFDYDRLVRLLEERISLAPRYRQKVRTVPGHLANPMWVDDPAFDIGYHVRRSALPRPGTDRELLEFCARIESRLLDRARPLWEIYLVEGLSDGRLAILTKTHEAMVGDDGIDLAQVILDAAPAPRRTVETIWMPQAEPGPVALVRDAVLEVARRPLALADTARAALRDVGTTVGRATSLAGGVVSAGRAIVTRPVVSPLAAALSEQRRLAVARTRLADYRAVRDAFGGTVNDAMLAVVTGALRGWLQSRSEPLRAASTVRALVPVGVSDAVADRGDGGYGGTPPGHGDGEWSGLVRPLLVDLPVGEPDPVLRLAQLRYAMASHKASGRAVGADSLAALSGFAPPTLHALGARAASGLTRRMFQLVVTNVPGPQWPLYASGARMTETFPIVPLGPGQALSIAVSSYDGGVFYGINADRDAVPDVAQVAELIEESLAELVAVAAEASNPRGGGRGSAVRR
ncbi:wax ester/triacylglycerol synthase family O-acyltransferase [Jatrophihabitans endophyticus]|uniref:WS/DGAT/MGAT family O-acyltransferase n=1 Tax=Jatrophihabitans endophyticus TaxID=1206085 RepID=UPI001A0C0340|nr:wax ester/triacylglycerol synthase family O-acyltransferase [Jatrophihabitans endophyticus]MBE7187833.1 wax ester/triacylglycerol synthase family O-acyltransferase [Jatrophihabitans endophyticus]